MAKLMGIYQIRNLSNGKVYVGSGLSIEGRWASHRHRLNKGTHHSRHLQASWNKSGEESFAFEVLEEIDDPTQLIPREQYWIDAKNASNRIYGYNAAPKAGSPLGMRHTEEAKRRMSISRMGKKLSEETRRKLSEINKGRPCPEKTRKAVAISNKTRQVSEDTREKLRAALSRRIETEEIKQKRINSLTGKPKSESHRAKLSEALTGRSLPISHRETLSRTWCVTSPDGNSFITKLLRDFAVSQNLSYDMLLRNAKKGNVKKHKGWMCVEIIDPT